nr:Os01g0141150 [Ipomoea batatas]
MVDIVIPDPQSHRMKLFLRTRPSAQDESIYTSESRKLIQQNHGLLQGLLGALEPSNIIPLHIRLLPNDRGIQSCPKLSLIGILPVLPPILGLGLGLGSHRRIPSVGTGPRSSLVKHSSDFLGAAQVLGELVGDRLLDLRVLLVLEVSLEVFQRIHVERKCLGVVPSIVFLHCLPHVLNRLLLEVTIHP